MRSLPVLKQIIVRVVSGVLSGVVSFLVLAMLGVVTFA
jgi:hypothetical protein